jgi:ABC-type transport system substrate-binding protein
VREDAFLYDATRLEAEDVAAAINRTIEMRRSSGFHDPLLICADCAAGENAGTVRFRLHSECPLFPLLVSSLKPGAYIMRPTDGGGFAGTGPYHIERVVPQQGAVLARNQLHWRRESRPAELHIAFFDSYAALCHALRTEAIDVTA